MAVLVHFVLKLCSCGEEYMSSDNPYEQVEALIATDERQQPPEIVDGILEIIGSKVPGAERPASAVTIRKTKTRESRPDAADCVGGVEAYSPRRRST